MVPMSVAGKYEYTRMTENIRPDCFPILSMVANEKHKQRQRSITKSVWPASRKNTGTDRKKQNAMAGPGAAGLVIVIADAVQVSWNRRGSDITRIRNTGR